MARSSRTDRTSGALCTRRLQGVVLALCTCLLAAASPSYAQQDRYSWKGGERVIAFADVHGADEDLKQLLRSAGVVDTSLRWSAGSAHVVSLGDLLDRGAGSRKVMDLLMRLQQEAAAAGGALHVVLGNHEAMNLLGDMRYATPEELASYDTEEPTGLRDRLRDEWVAQHGQGSAAQFDARFPRGYFGHRAAFANDGQYGRWLLSLPVAVVIGDTLFMHAGPSQVLSGLSIQEINRRYHAALSDYLSALDGVTAIGLVRIEDSFAERATLAEKRLAATPAADASEQSSRANAVRRFVVADRDPMLGLESPNWYRGAALCREASESDVLRPLLAGLGMKRLVIGHTVTRNGRVASRFDGSVIKLDTGMNRAVYRGHPAALVLEPSGPRVVYADESGPPGAIPAEPLYVSPSRIDDTAAAVILADGTVTTGAARAPGTFDVLVELNGLRVSAVFMHVKADAARRELAAYRLDRALGLGLVPATVQREVKGQVGILQARPERSASQADVEAQALRPGGWCALDPQFKLMYAFDALIGNEGRTPERILYDASDWMLLLTGHDRAFTSSKKLPRHLQARPPQPGTEMQRRLATLDAASLAQTVGDVLTERERAAVLARRDALLRRPQSRVAGF